WAVTSLSLLAREATHPLRVETPATWPLDRHETLLTTLARLGEGREVAARPLGLAREGITAGPATAVAVSEAVL
ncbi:MAG: hypothetical protein LC808_38760, partial [Actinobacteria bacterium]|nr:hypothetical protein [Actinomycetota bacterium]